MVVVYCLLFSESTDFGQNPGLSVVLHQLYPSDRYYSQIMDKVHMGGVVEQRQLLIWQEGSVYLLSRHGMPPHPSMLKTIVNYDDSEDIFTV